MPALFCFSERGLFDADISGELSESPAVRQFTDRNTLQHCGLIDGLFFKAAR